MNLRAVRPWLHQQAVENQVLGHGILAMFMAWGSLLALFGSRRRALIALAQVHRSTRLPWMRKWVEPYIVRNRHAVFGPPVLERKEDITRFFGNRIAVLKEPGSDGEKGALFVMFSEMLSLLFAAMDVPKLLRDYTLVFEPSSSGYGDEDVLRYTQFTDDIFVLAAQKDDFAFLQRLGSNLIPVNLGPCDWVDPRVAEPYLTNPKEFDIVMNANWVPLKRHYVLFHMLKHAKKRYRVALIGGALEGTTWAYVERLARRYGVREQLEVFERIPYKKVMDITCRAKVAVLLSLKEGSNRAIAESMFCDVPVIVLSNHIGGIVKNVVPETGLLSPESELELSIGQLIEQGVKPRAWALEHISCFRSAENLNAVMKARALSRGLPWTRNIAGRSNRPESDYINEQDGVRLRPWNQGLRQYLR